MTPTDRIIRNAFAALGKALPDDEDLCLYKSGHLDSYDLMQVLLEMELSGQVRLDLARIAQGDISFAALRAAMDAGNPP